MNHEHRAAGPRDCRRCAQMRHPAKGVSRPSAGRPVLVLAQSRRNGENGVGK
ncbi:hypothetical protein [Streptomyces sp. NPDC047070]|uniref:hypothetical protein n=1 Tax=Streptomyces sp. NPDC047070 TaxID=3154923 RepID=UPI0034557567